MRKFKPRPADLPRCMVCGKPVFAAYRRKYCSDECAKKAGAYHAPQVRKPKERVSQGTCILCGKPLPPKRIAYCSNECSKKAYDIRKRELEKAEKARDEALFKEVAEAKKKSKKQKAMSWTRILKGMEKTGLSYGEYVARYENGESEL